MKQEGIRELRKSMLLMRCRGAGGEVCSYPFVHPFRTSKIYKKKKIEKYLKKIN